MAKRSSMYMGLALIVAVVVLVFYFNKELRFQFHKATNTTMFGPEVDKDYDVRLKERDRRKGELEDMLAQKDFLAAQGREKDWANKVNLRELMYQEAEAEVRVFPDIVRLPVLRKVNPDVACISRPGNHRIDWSRFIQTYWSEEEKEEKSRVYLPCSRYSIKEGDEYATLD